MASGFSLEGRVALVTGGTGVLGGVIARGLAGAGARVAVLGRRADVTRRKAAELAELGHESLALIADVLDEGQLRAARDELVKAWGRLDILVNAAGGNVARARDDNRSVFDVPLDAFEEVLRLNLHGTVLPSMVFGEVMTGQRKGCILNISSMAATQALSGVGGYGVAKGAIDNYTRYLAVQLARRFGDGMRVNAVAPGFFLSEQNRALLVNEDGTPKPRAQQIFGKTPMGRFGKPEELLGAVLWLCSDEASFVTGIVVPVDGGFSAFSGV